MSRQGPALGAALLMSAVLTAAGCAVDEKTSEAAVNVLTLQTGTTSDLRRCRGQGPFRIYDASPAQMLEVLEAAMRRARGTDGPPYVEVYVSARYGEVLAKEFPEEGASYGDAFRTAALAIVHPVRDRARRSRVEIHDTTRGPFHRGHVRWKRDLDRWIDEELDRLGRPSERPPPAIRSLRERPGETSR